MTAGDRSPLSPGGPEHRITYAPYSARIAAVGATLRELRYEDRDLIVSYPSDQVRPNYRGAVIAPWPNRIADGRYEFDGQEQQVPINEIDRHNALHGLVHWVRWHVAEAGTDHLVLTHDLVAQQGYPYPLRLQIEYRLGADGLTTTLQATNVGDRPAPYGCCPHPYLKAGSGLVDQWVLTVPAATRLEVDQQRLLPTSRHPVTDVDSDFRTPQLVAGREIDHAFTDLTPGQDGRTVVEVWNPDERVGVQMTWGKWAPWVQVHTADRPEPEHHRVGLAVEPMSCPPDAFNSRPADVTLEPGRTHVAEWTIAATG